MGYGWLVFVAPWLGSLAIVLNIYNGDVLPIQENLEYMIWYAVPLVIDLICCPSWQTLSQDHVLIVGLACNLFWYFESPFYTTNEARHRTEFYDTQALLCALLYHSMYERGRIAD